MSVPAEGELVADRYRVVRGIGQGAMGAVFEVLDERSNRRYALKWIDVLSGAASVEQLRAWAKREIKALQLLQHPAILQLFDHGETESAYWVLTELLAGEDLFARISKQGPLDGKQCAAVATMLCSALAAAHAEAIVHRDCKPGNLFLCNDGRFVLLDFGIAKAAEGSREDTMAKSANTVIAGTASFLSPELVGGAKATPASDMFAVGGTLQWLLTRQLPFRAENMLDMLKAIAAGKREPIDRSDLALDLHREIDRLLERDPAARPTAEMAARTFAKIAGGEAAVRVALIELAAQKTSKARLLEPIEDGASNTQIVTTPVAGGHTQIATPHATQIVSATAVVTSPSTQPSASPPRRLSPVWIAAPLAGLVIAGGAWWATRAARRAPVPVVSDAVDTALPPPQPDTALPPPQPDTALPPPSVPDVVAAPPPVPAAAQEKGEDRPAREDRTADKRAGDKRDERAGDKRDERAGVLALSFEHWVELSLDGKPLGRKEFATKLTLPPGRHTLVAEHPRFGVRRFPIDARPGRTVSLHIDLAQSE